jgi:hypothetical protein
VAFRAHEGMGVPARVALRAQVSRLFASAWPFRRPPQALGQVKAVGVVRVV